ncbi:MAG: glycosyltransferase family 2 protein [Flavobacteriales bacterium]|nr:glycosyltransferase family 2 protein [Flavobacteriales bacterium]
MKGAPKIEIVIVMPAYNEEACIEDSVLHWISFLKNKFNEDVCKLIVINDGSKDNTGSILEKLEQNNSILMLINQSNQGHGAAVLNGYQEALRLHPEWVFQTDSDNQFTSKDFEELWRLRNQSKFILGYRKVRHDDVNRLIITRILRILLWVVFQKYIKDSNVPYRLINANYLNLLLQQLDRKPFAPNIFISVLAAKDKQKLFEIPIQHLARTTGTVSIVKWSLLKVSLKSAMELITFRRSLNKRLKKISEFKLNLNLYAS